MHPLDMLHKLDNVGKTITAVWTPLCTTTAAAGLQRCTSLRQPLAQHTAVRPEQKDDKPICRECLANPTNLQLQTT